MTGARGVHGRLFVPVLSTVPGPWVAARAGVGELALPGVGLEAPPELILEPVAEGARTYQALVGSDQPLPEFDQVPAVLHRPTNHKFVWV